MKIPLFILYISLTVAGNSTFAAIRIINHNRVKHNYTSDVKPSHYLFMIKEKGISDNNLKISATEPHLRLQLYKDDINTDDTYIGFEPSAKTQYVFNEDAPYFQGNGRVNLASISSDNVELAINRLPLPVNSETIRLYVEASADGTYKLNMTEDEGIPALYEVWLMDAYKKDSLNMRQNLSYTFNLLKADTNSFGSNRFSLVIRQNPALEVHLIDFSATKSSGGAQIAWKTENEQGYTNFTVERSTDGGKIYNGIDSLLSDSMGTYSFLDKMPPIAADQYRLKIQDLNGTVSYSNVITLMYSNDRISRNSITIYPNPATGIINFTMVSNNNSADNEISGSATAQNAGSASYNIKIINLAGIVVKTATAETETWQTDVSSFLPGTYIIQMVKNGANGIVGKSTFIKL